MSEEYKKQRVVGEVDEVAQVELSKEEQEQADYAKVSSIKKMIDIFIAPTEAFKAVKARPNILIPMILLPIFSLLYYLLFWTSYEIQMIQMLEQQFASMGMELTRDMLQLQLTIQRWMTPIGAVFGVYFSLLIASLIYWVIAKILKSQVTYKQTFSMLVHASLISSLLWVFHMIITALTGESNILAPMTSLASLLPDSAVGSLLHALLTPLEVFGIWYFVVLYFGLNIVSGLSKRASGIIVLLSFILTMALTVGSLMMTNLAGGL